MRYLMFLLCSVAIADEPVFKPTGRYAVDPGKPAQRQWYLVSEPWCIRCPAAKDVFRAKGWPESNILTLAECEKRFGFRPPHVPFEFGEPIKKTGSGIYTGQPGSSHQSRETLIDHLLNDGIHKGRHTLASLNAMTDEQLDALHTQDHGTIERRPVIQQRGGRWFSWGRRR